eukprot:m.499091 g.499091  ORF g.499091 m.499091 type:complete len:444 (+) comp57317_c0_seq1:2-1333(+)
MEINGQFAVSLEDSSLWMQLGRLFCEARLMGSLSVVHPNPECLAVLRAHFSRTWALFSLRFQVAHQPRQDMLDAWDAAFSWMTELLQNNKLVALAPLGAEKSPILTSAAMPAFYDSLRATTSLKSLHWGGIVPRFSPDLLPDLVSAVRANVSVQELSLTDNRTDVLGLFHPVLSESLKRNKALPGMNVAVANGSVEGSLTGNCPQALAKRLLRNKFHIDSSFFNPEGDKCFCEFCIKVRGDAPLHSHGVPPSKYALPIGFVLLGILQTPGFLATNRVFESWHMSYHGTKAENLEQIFNGGLRLLKAGDVMLGGKRLGIPAGHIQRSFKLKNLHTGQEEEFNPLQIFTSPSPRYSAHGTYAPKMIVDDPDRPEQLLSLVFMFQVRQRPGSYGIGQETVGATDQGIVLDERFSNNELEFYTTDNTSLCLTGLLIRVRREGQSSVK